MVDLSYFVSSVIWNSKRLLCGALKSFEAEGPSKHLVILRLVMARDSMGWGLRERS
jgi:hypothetical protein